MLQTTTQTQSESPSSMNLFMSTSSLCHAHGVRVFFSCISPPITMTTLPLTSLQSLIITRNCYRAIILCYNCGWGYLKRKFTYQCSHLHLCHRFERVSAASPLLPWNSIRCSYCSQIYPWLWFPLLVLFLSGPWKPFFQKTRLHFQQLHSTNGFLRRRGGCFCVDLTRVRHDSDFRFSPTLVRGFFTRWRHISGWGEAGQRRQRPIIRPTGLTGPLKEARSSV